MENRNYLYVHAIWSTREQKPLLKKPVRKVLFGFLQSWAGQNLVRIIQLGGVDDHIHCLLQIHVADSVLKTVQGMRNESAAWIRGNRLMAEDFGWDEGFVAYSVSPSHLQQVSDYIEMQEVHHQKKSLDSELESLDKIRT